MESLTPKRELENSIDPTRTFVPQGTRTVLVSPPVGDKSFGHHFARIPA
jgi:hypothetical protein